MFRLKERLEIHMTQMIFRWWTLDIELYPKLTIQDKLALVLGDPMPPISAPISSKQFRLLDKASTLL